MTTRARGLRVLLAAAAVIVAGACELPAPTVPSVEPGLVVFSVLDPALGEQVVLLMETRAVVPDTTLRVTTDDPIVTSGETPVLDARVVLYGPNGDSAVAVEDRVRRPDHLGAGVYRIWSLGAPSAAPADAFLSLLPGQRIRLKVTSAVGSAAASTQIPGIDRVITGNTVVMMGRDSLVLTTTPTGAGGFVYSLRNSNNVGREGDEQYHRALERHLIMPGVEDEWAFSYAVAFLRRLTRHTVTVTAVDSNYFAYFGESSDPFKDRSAGTNLRGAAGVFGSSIVFYSVVVNIN
ncbi:MAG: hypothetical protein JWO05_3826 [Gemmatimonadetes bacterium]|nr:hypothetical protein [Gemmatimonadota bacterium]